MKFEVERYYDARTEEDLRMELDCEGYELRYNDDDLLEIFEVGGGYQTTIPYWEKPTNNTFDSVYAAHRWVFGELLAVNDRLV